MNPPILLESTGPQLTEGAFATFGEQVGSRVEVHTAESESLLEWEQSQSWGKYIFYYRVDMVTNFSDHVLVMMGLEAWHLEVIYQCQGIDVSNRKYLEVFVSPLTWRYHMINNLWPQMVVKPQCCGEYRRWHSMKLAIERSGICQNSVGVPVRWVLHTRGIWTDHSKKKCQIWSAIFELIAILLEVVVYKPQAPFMLMWLLSIVEKLPLEGLDYFNSYFKQLHVYGISFSFGVTFLGLCCRSKVDSAPSYVGTQEILYVPKEADIRWKV